MYPQRSKIPSGSSHAESERAERPYILTINGGSSSLKFALFALTDGLERLLSGRIERIGMPGAKLIVAEAGREQEDIDVVLADQAAALDLLIERLGHLNALTNIAIVGHRVVHGGDRFFRPELITPEILKELRTIVPYDPDHLPGEIGAIDPGLVRCLMRARGLTIDQFQNLVNHESGLLGVSETSHDLRDLLARQDVDVRAAEAVALFCYRAKTWLGALAAALGGVDTLVFAGGIGENSPEARQRICEGFWGHPHFPVPESGWPFPFAFPFGSLSATYGFAAESAAPKEIGLGWGSRGSPIYSVGLGSRAASLTPVARRVQMTVASSSVLAFT